MGLIKSFLKTILLVAAVFTVVFLADIGAYRLKNHFFPKNKVSVPVGQSQSPAIINPQEEQKGDVFEGTEDDVVALANKSRTENGVGTLKKNEKLMASAMAKAQDMKDKHYFEHVSPEGLQPWFFVEKAGYRYKTVGENLAEGYFSAQTLHNAWMESEGHRKNILSPDFDEIGVAILEFEQNGLRSYIAVQHFGSQLKDEDLIAKTKCSLKSKQYCEDAEQRLDEIKDTIDKQEEIIKEAKKKNADLEDLKKAEDNLENLKDMKDEVKKYLKECDKFISGCDIWE
jgi:uncharacterized protein YkwD